MMKFKEAKKILYVGLSMGGPAFLNISFLLLVAKFSDIEQYGALAFFSSLCAIFVGFSDLGLRDFLLSRTGRLEDYAKTSVLFNFSLLIFGFFSILSTAYVFFGFKNEVNILFLFIFLLFESLFLGVFQKCINFEYQKNDDIEGFSKIDFFVKVFPLILKILVYFLSDKNILASIIASSILTCVFYSSWLILIFKRTYKSEKKKLLRKVFFDWRRWGVFSISFISFFLYFGADRILLKEVLGLKSLAVYNSAISLLSIGQILVNAIWSIYMPKISRERSLLNSKFYLVVSVMGVCVFIFFQFMSFWVYKFFYTSDYYDGKLILQLASAYFIFRFANVALEINFIVEDKYTRFVRCRVFFGLFSLFMGLVLMVYFGAKGMALSFVLAEMFLLFSSMKLIKRV